jgi:large subunit ribosomal protein L19e
MSSLQKRLAAKILKVGVSRIWLDPKKRKEIEGAITRVDIKKLIKKNYIKVLPEKLSMPKSLRRMKRGPGSRKGGKHAIVPAKRKWINMVRPLRALLRELKANQQIDSSTYKRVYKLIKGGAFRSRSHMLLYLEQHGLLKKK